ncbi:MAG: hypothetical protein O8C59_06010, partial [Candidatus Methanoperedens sp.]|nr:hypothetical protein [Candidatus Methanoperedens sp.]
MGLNIPDILIWWLALEIIGLAALPIAAYVCRDLKDHGYSASKPLGLLLLTYITWIISDLVDYSKFSVLFSLVLIAAASIIILRKKGLYVDKRYVIKFEILFLAGFLAFVI